jgi:hypothetical protein
MKIMAQANNATLDIINSIEMDDYRQSRLQTYGANFSSFILDSIDPNGAQGKTRGNQTHLLSNLDARSCTRPHRYHKRRRLPQLGWQTVSNGIRADGIGGITPAI